MFCLKNMQIHRVSENALYDNQNKNTKCDDL